MSGLELVSPAIYTQAFSALCLFMVFLLTQWWFDITSLIQKMEGLGGSFISLGSSDEKEER